jgi:tetratricopeptide (TPR) repeat protein
MTAPKAVRDNIARSRAYLARGYLTRALGAMETALRNYSGTTLIGQARFETEVHIHEFVNDLNRNHAILKFFEKRKVLSGPYVAYAPGDELPLAERLESIRHAMLEEERARAAEQAQKILMRKMELTGNGQARLDAGDLPRGRALLRRVADEWGHEPGVLTDIGQRFLRARLFFEAAELFESALDSFPGEAPAYSGAVAAYMELRDYPRAEIVYLRALRQFGAHPRTMLNLAKLYMEWRKRDKAYEYANRAMQADPSLTEARELLSRLTR